LSFYTPPVARSSLSHKSEVFFTAIVALIVVLFCTFSLIYLSHANSVATKGYEIKKLQEARSVINAELDGWNLKLTRLQSLNSLSGSDQIAKMGGYKDKIEFIEEKTKVALK